MRSKAKVTSLPVPKPSSAPIATGWVRKRCHCTGCGVDMGAAIFDVVEGTCGDCNEEFFARNPNASRDRGRAMESPEFLLACGEIDETEYATMTANDGWLP